MTLHRLRLLAGGALLATSCLAAACVPVQVRQPAAPGTPTPRAAAPATRAPTATGNRRLAGREAARLLGLAQVPARATRVRQAPHGLRQPVSRSGSTSLVDDHAFWTVPLPFTATVAWVRAHPPAGLTPANQAGGATGPGLRVVGIFYDDADSAAWTQAQYEVDVSRVSADTSAVRVDGMADWLDPRPILDDGEGRRVRVTVGAPCPANVAHVVGVVGPTGDQGALLATRMVPATAPTAAQVCSYSGLNGHPGFALAQRRLLGATPARGIAAAAAAVPLAYDSGAAFSCPADDGSVTVIALRYPGVPDVDLWLASSGCASLSNGRLDARAFDFPAALGALGL